MQPHGEHCAEQKLAVEWHVQVYSHSPGVWAFLPHNVVHMQHLHPPPTPTGCDDLWWFPHTKVPVHHRAEKGAAHCSNLTSILELYCIGTLLYWNFIVHKILNAIIIIIIIIIIYTLLYRVLHTYTKAMIEQCMLN